MLVLSEKVIFFYSKAFKYPHYKKVFIDENPKTGFSDINKQTKNIYIYIKMSKQKKAFVHHWIIPWFSKEDLADTGKPGAAQQIQLWLIKW